MAHHLPALMTAPGVRAGGRRRSGPRCARAGGPRGGCRGEHDDAGALLGRGDLDAVVIGAPSHLHADLATRAAAAGLHAYIEKPVAIDAAGAERVRQAVEAAGTIAVVGFNRRDAPALPARPAPGRARAHRPAASRSRPSSRSPRAPATMPTWKRDRASGGGVLLDLASHHIDQLRWLTGDEVERVSATCASDGLRAGRRLARSAPARRGRRPVRVLVPRRRSPTTSS